MSTSLGTVGIVDKGIYDAQTTYQKGNFVYYNGSTWIAKRQTTGNLPAEGQDWKYLARGQQGETPVTSVNGQTGAVMITRVAEAENLYSPDIQVDTAGYIFRTAGGGADLSSGEALITEISGHCDQTGGGTITIAHPTAFKAVGLNAFKNTNVLNGYTITEQGNIEASAGSKVVWAKAVGGLTTGYNVYSANGGITRVGYSPTVPAAGVASVVMSGTTQDTAGTLYQVIFENDGYVCVATTNIDKLCIHPRWSGYMNDAYAAYSETGFNVPTKDADGENLPTATYGFPSVGTVADTISFVDKKYTQRIGHYPYSLSNLAIVQGITSQYIYDITHIFYVLPTPVVKSLAASVSGSYTVHDFGTEEWLGTSANVTTTHNYGQNLRDKLRRDVLTISEQELTDEQKAQARKNINAGSVMKVNNEEPDSSGNVEIERVALADNLYSPDNSEDIGTYDFRTSGGSADLDGGDAQLLQIRGNSVVNGRIAEAIGVTVTGGITATVNADVWRVSTYGAASDTYVFTYDGDDEEWTDEDDNVVNMSQLGITVQGIKQDAVSAVISKPTITVTMNMATWISYAGRTEQTKTFTYDGTNWKDENNNNISLATIGATLSSTPVAYFDSVQCSNPNVTLSANVSTFEASPLGGASGTYVFTYDGTKWTYNNGVRTVDINLATYGIGITTGTPLADNTITIVYVAVSTTFQVSFVAKTASATVSVAYTKKAQGTISNATPRTFKSIGLNQFDITSNVIADATITSDGEIAAAAGYTVGYVHVVGGLTQGYTLYAPNGTLVANFGYIAEVPEIGDDVDLTAIASADPTTSYANIDEDGYLVFAVNSVAGGVCVHPTWSGYMDSTYDDYSDSELEIPQFEAGEAMTVSEFTAATALGVLTTDGTYNIVRDNLGNWKLNGSTVQLATYGVVLGATRTPIEGSCVAITISGTGTAAAANYQESLPISIYGMPSVGDVRDEMNLDLDLYTQRIGMLPYSASNLVTVQAMGVDYDYDLSRIYYVLTVPVTYTLPSWTDTNYTVHDFGTEEFLGTTVDIYAVHLYGQNLRDKLRRNVLTISSQDLTESQKSVVRSNLDIPSLANLASTNDAIADVKLKVGNTDSTFGIVRNNAFYGGNNYTNKTNAELKTMLNNGKLFPGDYFDRTLGAFSVTNSSVTFTRSSGTVRYYIAHLNYFNTTGYNPVHINNNSMVLIANIGSAAMNSSNTTAGAWYSCAMRANLNSSAVVAAIKTSLSGLTVEEGYGDLLPTAVGSDGKASSWGWYTETIRLMNENVVYGGNIWSSGHDTGILHTQFAIFRMNPRVMGRVYWWLSSVGSSASFCDVASSGNAGYGNASSSNAVVPLINVY